MALLKATMPGLADALSRWLDRPVVDMTKLKGSYRLEFDVAREDMRALAPARSPCPAASNGDGPSTAAGPSGRLGIFEN